MLQRLLSIIYTAAIVLVIITTRAISQQQDQTELTIFAAASLGEVFKALGKEFQSTHPQIRLEFNFAGSQQLVQQISQGGTPDVFASANVKQMDAAVKTGRIDSSSVRIFARNRLVVISPHDNQTEITSLNDLALPNIKIVLAANVVPVGEYSLEFLTKCDRADNFSSHFKENVLRNVVSYEENVRAVLAKVILGECDAGIVYTTDIATDTSKRIRQITIPDNLNVIAEYPVAVIKDSKQEEVAKEFVRYLCSNEGQSVLQRFGFITVSTDR